MVLLVNGLVALGVVPAGSAAPLALGREGLSRFAGWFLTLLGVPTCTVSALFLLEGRWTLAHAAGWAALAGLLALSALSWGLARSSLARSEPASLDPERHLAPDDQAPHVRTTQDLVCVRTGPDPAAGVQAVPV